MPAATKSDGEDKPSTRAVSAPPEKPASVWTRRLIVAAFWAVAVFLGLPHWTWATSLHRSKLPLEAMHAWAEGNACQLEYPLHILVQAPHLQHDQASALASHLETLLNQDKHLWIHSFRVHSVDKASAKNISGNALTIALDTNSAATTPDSKLRSWESVLDVRHQLLPNSDTLPLAAYIAPQIKGVFEDENASLWHLLRNTPYAKGVPSLILSSDKIAGLEKKITRAFKYASTYHLTFSMFTPTASPSAWAIDEAIQESIVPLVTHLSSISRFTIDTQVQLFASFSPSIAGPTFDEVQNQWTLHYSDLTGFVNAAEWPLSPSIGSGPTINLVLYIPSPERRPLLIEGSGASSWIIPQWGGVQIHNAPMNGSDALNPQDLHPDMMVFADQLAALLGIPESPASFPLRMSSLTRQRATSLILSASSTLGALSRLTLKLTSIAIPNTVAKSVDESLWRLDQACQELRKGGYQNALEHAREAEVEMEKAFFEPSMVGQVYFPEEHKVAVYVPLLGPMAVPLIMAALKEIRKLRERKVKIS